MSESRRDEAEAGISACLLIKDDNSRLIEWLAYHYHVLPLRHLVIAIDPGSRTTPLDILKRWDDGTHLEYVLWEDEDYTSAAKLMDLSTRVPQEIVNGTISKQAMIHAARQKYFLAECYKYHKALNRSWVIHIDTDEYALFNAINGDEPRYDGNNRTITPNRERRDLPIIGQSTILRVLERKNRRPCHAIPRLLFVDAEPADAGSEKGKGGLLDGDLPAAFEPRANGFDTLRYLRHHPTPLRREGTRKLNGLAKVLVDVSRIPAEDLEPGKMRSIHRPFVDLCPDGNIGPEEYVDSILRINHYLGSWEAYSSRQDVRRSRGEFDRKNAAATGGPSRDILPWLKSFIESVGARKAGLLLEGIGEMNGVVSNGDLP